jgi:hypothetical protein
MPGNVHTKPFKLEDQKEADKKLIEALEALSKLAKKQSVSFGPVMEEIGEKPVKSWCETLKETQPDKIEVPGTIWLVGQGSPSVKITSIRYFPTLEEAVKYAENFSKWASPKMYQLSPGCTPKYLRKISADIRKKLRGQ